MHMQRCPLIRRVLGYLTYIYIYIDLLLPLNCLPYRVFCVVCHVLGEHSFVENTMYRADAAARDLLLLPTATLRLRSHGTPTTSIIPFFPPSLLMLVNFC
ncbi:unnamed protein product [Choristocarpus tenellus]